MAIFGPVSVRAGGSGGHGWARLAELRRMHPFSAAGVPVEVVLRPKNFFDRKFKHVIFPYKVYFRGPLGARKIYFIPCRGGGRAHLQVSESCRDCRRPGSPQETDGVFHAHAVLGSDSCRMVPNIVSCNAAGSSSGLGQT